MAHDNTPRHPLPGLHQQSRFFDAGSRSGGQRPNNNIPAAPHAAAPSRLQHPKPGLHQFGQRSLLQRMTGWIPKKLIVGLLASSAYGALLGETPRAYEAGNSAAREMLSRADIVNGLQVAQPSANPETPAHGVVSEVGSAFINFALTRGAATGLGVANGFSESLGKVDNCHRTVEFNLVSLPAIGGNLLAGFAGGVMANLQGGYDLAERAQINAVCSQVPGPWDHLSPDSGTPSGASRTRGTRPPRP